MNSDFFEKNIGKLVRQAALPADDATRDRARAEFLRTAQPRPAARSWALAVAAAALLLAALVYGATRTETPTAPPSIPFTKDPQDAEPAFATVPGSGGDHFLSGVLKGTLRTKPTRTFRFQGRCPLPDTVSIQVRVFSREQRFERGRLESGRRDVGSFSCVQQAGGFQSEWWMTKPGFLIILVNVLESMQDMSVVDAVKRIPGSERSWQFDYTAWDDALLALLDPQLAELADLAREARDLVARVEAASAAPELFKASEKALIADARRLEARANGFAGSGLYPAAALQVARTTGDLAGSMAIFAWKNGKFEGPVSYYTDGKRGKTFRGDLFDFDALRRYLDEAVVCAGREFDLWIVDDVHRAGLRPALLEAVARSAKRPGVVEFAQRLTSEPDRALVDEIRQIAR